MKIPKIQAVCGFGCGSSLMLRMNIDEIAKKGGYEIETFCGDIGSCCSNQCDVIFISQELAERIANRASVPVIVIENFMNKKEVEEKVVSYMNSLQ